MADDRLDHRTRPSTCRRCTQDKRGADAQGLGRSRGGLSTRIYAATEALGLPVRLIRTPGQRNDIALTHELIDGINAGAALADKGYDADHLVDRIEQRAPMSSFRPGATGRPFAPMTSISTGSAIALSASSASCSSSGASQPGTTSFSPTSWAT